MLKVTVGKRTYPTGIKRVDDIITIWMVTLSMLVNVNMPMNLMGAGITAAPTVSLGIGRHFTFKDSYFGGRTNAIVLHREFPPNSHGGYLEFCSLYPYILKYERYPIGHPTHFTNNFSPFFKVCCKGGGRDLAISWALPCVKDGIGEYLVLV